VPAYNATTGAELWVRRCLHLPELHRSSARSGAASWVAHYRGRRDFANATDLAVSPAGRAVFVTGFVGVHDGCCDFGTVAYQP
jgi:hypothetical protein